MLAITWFMLGRGSTERQLPSFALHYGVFEYTSLAWSRVQPAKSQILCSSVVPFPSLSYFLNACLSRNESPNGGLVSEGADLPFMQQSYWTKSVNESVFLPEAHCLIMSRAATLTYLGEYLIDWKVANSGKSTSSAFSMVPCHLCQTF